MAHPVSGESLGPKGRFRLGEVLGKGGSGIVHRAYDRQREADVALKILTRVDPLVLYLFKREFRELSGVTHPRLAQLFELFADGDTWFFTMELVDGVDFLTWIAGAQEADGTSTTEDEPTATLVAPGNLRTHGDPPPPAPPLRRRADLARLRPALRELAQGVRALHIARRLHLDLKPSNVLVRRDGSVVLLDFGLAQTIGSGNDHDDLMAGTPSYMAPEQIQSCPPTEATDWYALGVILYRSLAGRLPFVGSSIEILRQKLSDDPLPPSVFYPGVPQDLEALSMRLLARDPARRPDEAAVMAVLGGAGITGRFEAVSHGAAPAPASAERFVGRQDELRTLTRAVETTATGRAAVCFVHGPSGIGKSALLRSFFEGLRVMTPMPLVLEGRCYQEESVPYKGVDAAMDGLARYLSALPEAEVLGFLPRNAGDLAQTFPVLRRVSALAELEPSSTVDHVSRRQVAFAALREILRRLARRRRVILHVDDLHWSDADSVALLLEILHPPDPPPILLVASHRELERGQSLPLHRLREELARWPLVIRDLELGPLEADDLATLASELGVADVDAAVARSEGSPYFLAEIAQHGLRSETLEDGILARVAALPDDVRALVELVCVAGHPIESTMACRAAGGVAAPSRALAELKAARLLRGSGEGDRVEAYHDRIREVVVGSLGEERRRLHHRALALELERCDGDAVLQLQHLLGCGDQQRAAEQAEQAALGAREQLAFDRAAELYEVAIRARYPRAFRAEGARGPATAPSGDGAIEKAYCEGGPEPTYVVDSRASAGDPRRVSLHQAHGECLANTGRLLEAGRALMQAAACADQAGLDDAHELRRRGASLLLSGGAREEGWTAAEATAREVGLRLPGSRLGALVSFLWSDWRIRSSASEEPSVLSRRRIDTCTAFSIAILSRSPLQAAALMAKAAKIASRTGDPERMTATLAAHVASVAAFNEDRATALAPLVESSMAQVQAPYAQAMGTCAEGFRAYFRCRWLDCVRHLDRAETILQHDCTGVAYELQWTQTTTGFALGFMGEYDELARRLPAQIHEAEDRGDHDGAATLYLALGWLTTLAADDAEGLLVRADQVYEELDEQQRQFKDFYYALCKVTGLASQGRHVEAVAFMETKQKALARAGLFQIQLGYSLWVGGRAVQRIGAALEDPAQAKRQLRLARQDLKRLRSITVPYAPAYAHMVEAGLALAERNEALAAHHLEAAEVSLRSISTLGMAEGARWIRGTVVGGDEGAELQRGAVARLSAKGVQNIPSFTRMWLPIGG